MQRDRHTLFVIFCSLLIIFLSLRSGAQNPPGPKVVCSLFYHSSYESDATLNKQYNLIKLKNPRMAPSFLAYMKGMRNIRNGDYAMALMNFQSALKLIRSHSAWYLYYYIGVCQLATGQIRQGYDTLIKLQDVKMSKTQQYILCMELGAASFDLGKYVESAQWYRKTLSVDKNSMKWEIDGYPGDVNDVIAGVTQMKSLSDADKANFLLNISRLYFSLGEEKEMTIVVRASLKFNPNNGIAYEILGGREESNNNFQLAERLCKKALALDFNDPHAMSEDYSEIGNIQLKRHRIQEAISSFRKAVQLDPNNRGAAMSLLLSRKALGENVEIDETIDEVRHKVMDSLYNWFWTFLILLVMELFILLRYGDKLLARRFWVATGILVLLQAVIILLMKFASGRYTHGMHAIMIFGLLSLLCNTLFFIYYSYIAVIEYKYFHALKIHNSKTS